jgi:hypothetical protein
MYTDVRKWSRVRKRVMQLGESKRRVARTEKISRQPIASHAVENMASSECKIVMFESK